MNSAVFVIVGGLPFFLLLIPAVIFRAKQMSTNYGPLKLFSGRPQSRGTLICTSVNAPTMGKKLRFNYNFDLIAHGNNLTGCCTPVTSNGKTSWSVDVFMSRDEDTVKGRDVYGANSKIFEGKLTVNEANLTRGFPKGSLLDRLNGPLQFRITNGIVRFSNVNNSQTGIASSSRLTIENSKISGQLIHYRESWQAAVELEYGDIPFEMAVLAIIIMSDDILSHHHD